MPCESGGCECHPWVAIDGVDNLEVSQILFGIYPVLIEKKISMVERYCDWCKVSGFHL